MPYEIQTTTADGATHTRQADSLDTIDAYLGQVQYRGEGRLVGVSTDPIRFVYTSDIKAVAVTGVTREEIDEHIRKQQEAQQAQYQALADPGRLTDLLRG